MYLLVPNLIKPLLVRGLLCKVYLNPSSYQSAINYHCKSGVYGHKPKNKKPFKVSNKALENRVLYSKAYQLILAYREHGHKVANVNPLSINSASEVDELELVRYGLRPEERCEFTGLVNSDNTAGTIGDLTEFLKRVYCNTISAEFCQLQELEEREWFAERFEGLQKERLSANYKQLLLEAMLKSQVLDRFLAAKFVSLKRYGGEGAESMLSFFIELFQLASQDGVRNIVIGAHHRGRLNLLTGLLKMPPQLLFRKLQGKSEFPDDVSSIGDVISHLCTSADLQIDGRKIHVDMTNLPSHLEAVCPVSLGKTRCIQQVLKEAQYGTDPTSDWSDTIMNVLVHGDGAFMGQGVTQESLLMSGLPHFYTGGSVHLIVNNQLGFTTPPAYGRGTTYASDIAKILSAPVLHVNGESPEDVVKATQIAVEYQRKFRKNVFIDLNCYRRWGHNELDDPSFTDPLLYASIQEKRSIPDMYAMEMIKDGIVTEEQIAEIEKSHMSYLNGCLKNVDSFFPMANHLEGEWLGYSQAPNAITVWDTGFDSQLLQLIGAKSVSYPETFNVHPTLLKHHIQGRLSKIHNGKHLDWATAEALAFGSLLLEGYNVRISGQDVGRGTFSQRHAMLVDQKTDDIFIPLNSISPNQRGRLEVVNSMLSEEAVLGFEYGFSTISPKNLVIWEAQFGDFFNGAQIQIDTYITSGESKWCSLSGLVMILPHGYDGAGPEHSSCRLERFLQLTDSSECRPDGEDINFQVAYPTTPAQYFHLLRRQMVRNYRKPLLIVGPKSLLRSPDATSQIAEIVPNTHFHPVIGDDTIGDKNSVRRVVFVTGKHFYALRKYRQEAGANDTALIRVEELCPFPTHQIRLELTKFRNAKEYIWSQEEPQNMGAWTYCRTRFENLVGRRVRFCGRQPMAAPAGGIGEDHTREAQMVVAAPFQPLNKQSMQY